MGELSEYVHSAKSPLVPQSTNLHSLQHIFTVLCLLIRRHLHVFRLASEVVLNQEELRAATASLSQVLDAADDLIAQLTGS
jgi:hypothetical protein